MVSYNDDDVSLSTLVVIPAFNEASTIREVIADMKCHFLHILVIDDGSSDDTANIAAKSDVDVLRNKKNIGLAATLRRGFKYAKDFNFSTVLTMDGDGAHGSAFGKMVVEDHIKCQADLTIGSRTMDTQFAATLPTAKLAANTFATRIFNRVCESSLTDVASGLRALSGKALSLSIEHARFGGVFELIAGAIKRELKVNEFPIQIRYDARLPFLTAYNELLDFLGWSLAECPRTMKDTRTSIKKIVRGVRRREKLTVRFERDNLFFLYPVSEYNAYLFQQQNTWFDSGDSQVQAGILVRRWNG